MFIFCGELNICIRTQQFIYWNPNPHVIVLGGEDFRMQLELYEALRLEPPWMELVALEVSQIACFLSLISAMWR